MFANISVPSVCMGIQSQTIRNQKKDILTQPTFWKQTFQCCSSDKELEVNKHEVDNEKTMKITRSRNLFLSSLLGKHFFWIMNNSPYSSTKKRFFYSFFCDFQIFTPASKFGFLDSAPVFFSLWQFLYDFWITPKVILFFSRWNSKTRFFARNE